MFDGANHVPEDSENHPLRVAQVRTAPFLAAFCKTKEPRKGEEFSRLSGLLDSLKLD